MKLAEYNINIPKYWNHYPLLTDKYGNTIAMYYVLKKYNIPEQWKHDKLLKNNNG